MKLRLIRNIIRLLLLTAIFTPFLFFHLATTPAYAADILLNPSSATVGSQIQVIGEGFSGHLATIHFDDKVVATDIPILESGSLKYNLTIPKAQKGTHVIQITDDSNWSGSTATVDFVVKPSITVFPTVTKEYGQLTITGTGFSSSEKDINITIDGKVASSSTIAADRNGYWSTQLLLSEIDRGEHKIGAYSSASSAAEINTVDFIITPFVKMTPLSGPVGTQLLIYGWGFRGNEDGVSMTWDGEIIKVNIRAEIDGSLIVDGSKVPNNSTAYTGDTRDTLYVPPSTQGEHVLGVYGSSFTPRGTFNDNIFTVIPQIKLKTERDLKGTRIYVDGTGFGANEQVTLSVNETKTDNVLTADNHGSFATELLIQTGKGQEYVISGSGDKGNSTKASFTSSAGQSLPAELRTVSPAQGDKITTFDSVGDVLLGSVRYLVGLAGYMKGSPAKTDDLSSLKFVWTSSGIKGTTYIVQVAQESSFTPLSLEAKVSDSTEYILTPENRLANGKYVWRVKAVDPVGNESSWSEVSEFEIVPMSTKVTILTIIIIILIIAAIIIGILTLWANFARR